MQVTNRRPVSVREKAIILPMNLEQKVEELKRRNQLAEDGGADLVDGKPASRMLSSAHPQ